MACKTQIENGSETQGYEGSVQNTVYYNVAVNLPNTDHSVYELADVDSYKVTVYNEDDEVIYSSSSNPGNVVTYITETCGDYEVFVEGFRSTTKLTEGSMGVTLDDENRNQEVNISLSYVGSLGTEEFVPEEINNWKIDDVYLKDNVLTFIEASNSDLEYQFLEAYPYTRMSSYATSIRNNYTGSARFKETNTKVLYKFESISEPDSNRWNTNAIIMSSIGEFGLYGCDGVIYLV